MPLIIVPTVRLLQSPIFSTTDTLTAATINTTETAFASTLTIPAGFFIPGRALRVWMAFEYLATATVPTHLLRMRVQKSGPTNVNLYVAAAAPPGASALTSAAMQYVIQGTAAVGSSVLVETSVLPSGINGYTKNTLAQGVLIDTSVVQTLQFTETYGGNAASNTVTLRQLIGEVMGA